MDYEVIIGLEVHAQLLTKSKMFCSCGARYADAPPNTHVCPVCLGIPGVLPVINRRAMEHTIATALALNCSISECTKFDRKNYPYPDLMKGYQISQYDAPIGQNGWLAVETNGHTTCIGITRVHLEEDVAKLTHRSTPHGENYSLIDVNRSGVPLMEIVGEPDIRSPEEARQYLIKLRSILRYLGVSTGNMEEGSFRCDANISIRPAGAKELAPKVEVKNMNSFKAVYLAMAYEAERQKQLLESSTSPTQETRGWVEEKGFTVSQRSKEHAHDYRYFPEPDLPPLIITPEWIKEIQDCIAELPDARRDRFMSQYGLPPYDANLITGSKQLADLFESCASSLASGGGDGIQKQAKMISNWLLGDFSRLLNTTNIEVENSKITPQSMSEFLQLIDRGVISGPAAKAVFEEMFCTGQQPATIVAKKELSQITNASEITSMVEKVISENHDAVADYLSGKEQAVTFLVGQAMRATRGRANPQTVRQALIDNLGEIP